MAAVLLLMAVPTMARDIPMSAIVQSDDPAQQRNLVLTEADFLEFTTLVIEHNRSHWGNDFFFLTDPGWFSLEQHVTHSPGRVEVVFGNVWTPDLYDWPDYSPPLAIRMSIWGGWNYDYIERMYLTGAIDAAPDNNQIEAAPDTNQGGVIINGVPVSFPGGVGPVLQGGHNLVPVRGVFEHLGFVVIWEPGGLRNTVDIYNYMHRIRITLGSDIFYVDGAPHPTRLDVPAQLIEGRTMVSILIPLRAVGLDVGWNDATRTVIIEK
jgi:hypothetical protein